MVESAVSHVVDRLGRQTLEQAIFDPQEPGGVFVGIQRPMAVLTGELFEPHKLSAIACKTELAPHCGRGGVTTVMQLLMCRSCGMDGL